MDARDVAGMAGFVGLPHPFYDYLCTLRDNHCHQLIAEKHIVVFGKDCGAHRDFDFYLLSHRREAAAAVGRERIIFVCTYENGTYYRISTI